LRIPVGARREHAARSASTSARPSGSARKRRVGIRRRVVVGYAFWAGIP
jgi:hypothetical protein